MIKPLVGIAIAILAIIIQVTLLHQFISDQFKPDLLLIVVVFIALRSEIELAPASWMLGLIKDIYSGLYLGLNAFSFFIIFLTIKASADRLYAESAELFILITAISSMVSMIVSTLMIAILTSTPGVAYSIFPNIIPQILANTFAASLIAILPAFSITAQANK